MARSRIQRTGAWAGLAMTLPYLALLVVFGIVPIIMAFVTSMQPRMQVKGQSLVAVGGGFENFKIVLFDDPYVATAALHVLIFVALYVPVMLIVVSAMALMLDAVRSRWSVGLRAAYIVPACISGSVAILVWYFMLEPTYSPFAPMLHAMGLHTGNDIWAKENLAIIFVIMAFFTGAGNWIVIQYGSLQSISDDILEAAKIDGANAFQTALKIKLPLIRKYLIYMAILCFAAAIQIFVEPYLLDLTVYKGRALDWSLNQRAYSLAFKDQRMAYAAALSLLLLLVCIVVALFAIFKTDFFDDTIVSKAKKKRAAKKNTTPVDANSNAAETNTEVTV